MAGENRIDSLAATQASSRGSTSRAGSVRRLLLLREHPERSAATVLASALGEPGQWQVMVTGDPAEARRILREAPVDALVAEAPDARGSGAALLREVGQTDPGTIRVLLCDADPAAAVRALGFAHRVLPAHGHPSLVAETVLRIDRLHRLLNNPRLKALVGGVRQLPPAPKVYLELTTALADQEIGLPEVSAIVAADPALAAAVLRLSNTAFFSAGEPLASIDKAVMRLGTRTLRHLVLACEVFARRPGPTAIDPEILQQRALLASVLVPLVLEQWGEIDIARTAALLADIGQLLPPLPSSDGARPLQAEAGALLLAQWGLPQVVVEAVAFRHDPKAAGESRFGLVGAIHVSTALITGDPLDEDYLRGVGHHDRLQEWRKLAAELSAMA